MSSRRFIAVGEIGIDLYWDKTHFKEQEEAFRFQIELAIRKRLPVVIHSRDSFDDIVKILCRLQRIRAKGSLSLLHRRHWTSTSSH
jgi:Tat protein secretion system quality control protein TatD with DNase activity